MSLFTTDILRPTLENRSLVLLWRLEVSGLQLNAVTAVDALKPLGRVQFAPPMLRLFSFDGTNCFCNSTFPCPRQQFSAASALRNKINTNKQSLASSGI
jgi:hypothetical protein